MPVHINYYKLKDGERQISTNLQPWYKNKQETKQTRNELTNKATDVTPWYKNKQETKPKKREMS